MSIRYWDGDQKTENVADYQTIPNMANIVAEPVASSDATALVIAAIYINYNICTTYVGLMLPLGMLPS